MGGTGNLQTFDDDLEIFSYNILFWHGSKSNQRWDFSHWLLYLGVELPMLLPRVEKRERKEAYYVDLYKTTLPVTMTLKYLFIIGNNPHKIMNPILWLIPSTVLHNMSLILL